jgi:hypothetical protein
LLVDLLDLVQSGFQLLDAFVICHLSLRISASFSNSEAKVEIFSFVGATG